MKIVYDGVWYRKARMEDVEVLHKVIMEYAHRGLLLSKSRQNLYENLRDFVVAETDGKVVGFGALRILWCDLVEVRSLCVIDGYLGRGIGKKIVSLLEDEARDLGVDCIFALTYQEKFFHSCGFRTISHKELPHKVWHDCINCPKFPDCDEIAVIKDLK